MRALLERDEALRAIDEMLQSAQRGAGTALVIEGAPGIGKTAVLRLARELARSAGMTVLTAGGGVLEGAFAFGVARDLLSAHAEQASGAARLALPVLTGEDGGEAAVTATATERFAGVAHGLTWLVADLASDAPLALVVDDAHWIDDASLRWLAHLAHRIDDLPVALLLATRPRDAEAPGDALAIIAADPGARIVALEELSAEASARLVREIVEAEPDPGFALACHHAAGGNPFLLDTLVRAASGGEGTPSTHSVERIMQLGDRAVDAAVTGRMALLSPDALAIARAVSLSGVGMEMRHAAAIAGLDADRASAAADALTRAQLLEGGSPLRFAHPLVHAAVARDQPARARAGAHRRLAELLQAEGAPADHVAVHLMAADPVGDAATVAVLETAARAAFDAGAPANAVSLLRRALDEPPPPSRRGALLLALGEACAQAGDPDAVSCLEEARELVGDPAERARVALALGRALMFAGRLADATATFEQARSEVEDDAELSTLLELELIGAGRWDPQTRPMIRERLERLTGAPASPPVRRLVLANLAFELCFAGVPVGEIAAVAREAHGDGALIRENGATSPVTLLPTWALVLADDESAARAYLDMTLDDARRRGSELAYSLISTVDGMLSQRCGDLDRAEASALAALAREGASALDQPVSVATLLEVALARGRLDEAEQILERHGAAGDILPFPLYTMLVHARGVLRLAQRDLDRALADLEDAERRAMTFGSRGGLLTPWAAYLGLVHHLRGNPEEAARYAALAKEQGERTDSPRTLGIALRVEGLVNDDAGALETSARVLAGCPARLELAATLVELGAMLRRGRRRVDAREPLRQALDLAARGGAKGLADRAHAELLAAGARPRGEFRTGLEALTASELRVAGLAAEGLRNREIAQALFVSMKTVETHLGHAYQKLGVRSRDELAGVLAGERAPTGS